MPNYTKLFNSIVTSTIWTEDDKTRIVWITMLALSDQNGEVHASIPGLSRLSAVPVADVERALEKFVSPDPYSRTPDNEGRRIAKIDGGWELLNHAKYRKMASKEDSKAASAERVRRHRARNGDVTPCNASVTPCNAPVTECNAPVTVGRDIAEAEAEANTEEKITPLPPRGNKRRMSEAEKRRTKVEANTPQMVKIGAWFGRKPETLWTLAESEALNQISPTDKEIDGMATYYDDLIPPEKDYRRRDLQTLLNNWPTELDRARQHYKSKHP